MLFVDEVHRFSQTQQDALLPAVENRWVTLVAATTENPAFSVVTPLLSRSLLITLGRWTTPTSPTCSTERWPTRAGWPRPLGCSTTRRGRSSSGWRPATRAARSPRSRRPPEPRRTRGAESIDLADVERAVDRALVHYDRAGDQHYDVISAFIKSIRGRTSMPRCTTSPAWSRRARTRASSPAAW